LDLGSSHTLVYVKDKGVVVEEPTILARRKKRRQKQAVVVAFGGKAKEMVDKAPRGIEIVSPIKNGSLVDVEAAEVFWEHYLKMALAIPSRYPKVLKPKIVVGVSGGSFDVQKRALAGVLKRMGCGHVRMVESAVLAGIGIGLPVGEVAGVMVVDIGGGKSEASVVSMGGVVISQMSKIAGEVWDSDIVNYLKLKYGVVVGRKTAEKIKIEIGSALNLGDEKTAVVKGKDLESGLPKSLKVSEGEIREAMSLSVGKVVGLVKEVLAEAPPELASEIVRRGIFLVGRGSGLKGLARLMETETKISCRLIENPGRGVMNGIVRVIGDRKVGSQINLTGGSD